MQGKKKHKGTKAEIRAQKKRFRFIGTIITVAILVVLIAFSSFLIYSYLNPSSNQNTNLSTQLKVAIVDQLSLTASNQAFIEAARNILETANYTVDYYPSENVTVEFYKNLLTHDYSLIILRVHSALKDPEGRPLVFFTSQKYSSTTYVQEQLDPPFSPWPARIVPCAYNNEEAKKGILYFGINPEFVKRDMKGTFHNTTIIMMGCNGLTYTEMAEALIEKGARVYVGWNGPVSASHTDQATTQLLTYLTQNQTIRQAVENTLNEVGPDPIDNSTLDYYPKTPETQNYVILNTGSNLILKVSVATTISRRESFYRRK